jgi:hypothetical protein
MRPGWWLPVCLLVLGSTGYIAASRLTFATPQTAPVSLPDRLSDRAQLWRDVDQQRGYDHLGWWSCDGA